jgi:DNA-binding beta-propeller fold protein YncE
MCRLTSIFCLVFISLSSFAAEAYKGPSSLTATKDGKTIYVVNSDSHEIAVISTAEDKIVKTFSLGKTAPNASLLSADEKMLYVTGNGVNGQLLAIDTASGKIMKTASAGHTPLGLALTPDGKKLFVCNRFSSDVGEYDLPNLTLVRRIKVTREPRAAVVTKDGKYVLVANSIPLNPGNVPDDPEATIYVAAEISAINTADGTVKPIHLPNGSGSLHGICLSPDGHYAYVSEIIARFPLPTTQVERGWMNTAGIAVIDTAQIDGKNGGFLNTVLLDDVDQGAGNPWGITTSADGKKIYTAIAGTSEVIIIDAAEMLKKLEARAGLREQENRSGTPNSIDVEVSDDFAFLVGLKKRVKINGKGARAITVASGNIYVGMYFSDTIQKIDEEHLKRSEIALGAVPVWTPERRGEIWWNDATLCFQQWQSCASCHPDARMDGYNWDLLNDGLGNPKNAKSLFYCWKTPPAMWEGVRKTSAHCTRTGFQFILFAMPDEAKCKDIDAFLHAEQPVPSPYLVNGKLSAKAERGKKIFEDPKIGCAVCHPAPLFTDMKLHDVNTKCYYDRTSEFDTPTLIEVWRTAPYMHDGRYVNMRDVFKLGMHGDVEGDVSSLTDEQIGDLVEYILSL